MSFDRVMSDAYVGTTATKHANLIFQLPAQESEKPLVWSRADSGCGYKGLHMYLHNALKEESSACHGIILTSIILIHVHVHVHVPCFHE